MINENCHGLEYSENNLRLRLYYVGGRLVFMFYVFGNSNFRIGWMVSVVVFFYIQLSDWDNDKNNDMNWNEII